MGVWYISRSEKAILFAIRGRRFGFYLITAFIGLRRSLREI
ncbi:hypothetical protein J2T58_001542 [Methanocalculus alkaliphilus]|nr:hypothetical protein [Methanocalculus alkaliphilus]MCP1715675.1 hypothetical protein [Methanocalculus alkaliphilus]